MKTTYGSTTAQLERELDTLIDSMQDDLRRQRRSRYDRFLDVSYDRKGGRTSPSAEIDNLLRSESARSYDVAMDTSHREQLYSKYGRKYSPVMKEAKTSSLEREWFKSIGREGDIRSISPPKDYRPYRETPRAYGPTDIGRPVSALSRSPSPYASRAGSPILKYRSVSPKHPVIGPVTEMIERERKRELEALGQQEFYPHRDAQHGKPLPGRHGYMTWSWPYGLNNVADAYEYQNLRLPWDSPPESKIPPIRESPIHRRAKSVEPIEVKKIPERSRSTLSMNIPEISGRDRPGSGLSKAPSDHRVDSTGLRSGSPWGSYASGLQHIVVEQTPVPTPPRFGTLTYGGRYPNAALAPYKDGPPCELCHKPILEGRCIYAENAAYHCWHFYCSYCSKVLKENDFVMAADKKPYCVNCFKREYP